MDQNQRRIKNKSLTSFKPKIRASGYNLFCSTLKSNDIDTFGKKWKALPKEEQKMWQERAKVKSTLPASDKDIEKEKKKLLNVLYETSSKLEKHYGFTVGGMVATGDRLEVFGGDKRLSIISEQRPWHLHFAKVSQDCEPREMPYQHRLLNLRQQVRAIFNKKYDEALVGSGRKIRKVAYNKPDFFDVIGLPPNIQFKDPAGYGSAACRKIIEAESNITILLKREDARPAERREEGTSSADITPVATLDMREQDHEPVFFDQFNNFVDQVEMGLV